MSDTNNQPQPDQTKQPRKWLTFALLSIAVVIVAGGTATVLAYLHNRDTAQNTPTTPSTSKTVDKASALAFNGDVAGGVKALDNAIKNSKDTHQKFIYTSNKATILFNDNQLDAALTAAKQAFALEPSASGAALIGQIAQQNNDTTTAITYYKKAISLVDANNNPLADQDKQYYKSIISDLEVESQ